MFLMLTPHTERLPLYLTGIGVQAPEVSVDRPNGLATHQIALVTQGEGELLSPVQQQLTVGDCFSLAKKCPHCYRALTPPMHTFWILYNGTAADTMTALLTDNNGGSVFSATAFSTLLAKAQTILQHAENKPEPAHLSALLYDFLTEALRQKETKDTRQALLQRLRPAVAFMETHLAEAISLEAIAATIPLSKFTFCKLFRQAYEITPFAYLMQLRLQNAKSILAQGTSQTVKEAALSSGFHDLSYFSTVFKRCEKMTPKEFQIRYGKSGN